MKRVLPLILFICAIAIVPIHAQLTEDFNCDNPPCLDVLIPEWLHEPTFDPGNASGRWSFVNPGNVVMPSGFNTDMMIFDATYQPDGQGDTASIITAPANCSNSSNVFLKFSHWYQGGPGAVGIISVSTDNGFTWTEVETFYNSMPNPEDALFNITNLAAGQSNVRVKFTWHSPLELGFWAVTYLEIFSPVLLDASIVSLLSPIPPLSSNQQDIIVSVMNTGATEIDSIAFQLTIGDFDTIIVWYGNIPVDGMVDSIYLGSFEFLSGVLSNVNITVLDVNGYTDIGVSGNNLTTAVAAPLCGVYTIGNGGVNCGCSDCPNFANFTDAANFLNTYGVSCQTTFWVSEGQVFNEQIQLGEIFGASDVNNIIFRGCHQNGALPQLYYNNSSSSSPCVVELIGTDFIEFEYLDIWSESESISSFYFHDDNEDVAVQHCRTSGVISRNGTISQFRFIDNDATGKSLSLNQTFSGDSIIITGNKLDSIIVNNSNYVYIENNEGSLFANANITGAQIGSCSDVVLSNNNIRHVVTSECFGFTMDHNDFDTLIMNGSLNIYAGHNDINVGNFTSGDSVEFEYNDLGYFHFYDAHNVTFKYNEVNNSVESFTDAILFSECSDLVMRSNSVNSDYGISVGGLSSYNVVVADNTVEPYNAGSSGRGISFFSVYDWVRADSNIIEGFSQYALYAYCPEATGISNIRFNSNTISDGRNNAIRIDAGAIEVGRNRIYNYSEGSAIYLNGAESNVHNNYIHVEGIAACSGIEVAQGAFSSSLCFNSVLVESSDQYNSAALTLSNFIGSIDIKNNCFSNEGSGSALIVNGSPDLNSVTGGNNNFYSLYNRLAKYNGENISAWLSFASNMGGLALNATNVIPMYTSDIDLQCNHYDLNNSGVYCEMNADIDLFFRPNNAIDIGAKKWDLCLNDASVTSFNGVVNPVVNDSLYPMYVTLMNMGTNELTTADVGWTVNGILQPSNTWSGNLAPGQSENFFIGFYQFSADVDVLYELSAFVSSANNVEDCNHYNDTIVSIKYAIPLCGTIIVGSQSDDQLENFTELSAVLNLSGIECQTLVLVRAGTYDEKFILDSIPGTDMHSIVIQSFNLDPNSVILGSMVANPSYSVLLNGTRKFRLDKIGITALQPVEYENLVDAVYIDSNATDITLSGCNFWGRVRNDVSASCGDIKILSNSFNGRDFISNCSPNTCRNYLIEGNIGLRKIHASNLEELSIRDNTVGGGIYEFNIALSGIEGNLWVEGNTISSVWNGISIGECDSVFARLNTVELSPPPTGYTTQGMRFTGLNYLLADTNEIVGTIASYGMLCENTSIGNWQVGGNLIHGICGKSLVVSGTGGVYKNNRILSGTSGVGIDCNANSATIINNYVSLHSNLAVSGIQLNSQSNSDTIAYNTVSVSGLFADISNAASISGNDHLIVNNIFAGYDGAVAIKYEDQPSNFNSNFNCYHSDAGVVWDYNNSFFSTLSAFLSAAGLSADVNSIIANPYFGDNNLISSQGLLNGSGTTQFITETDIMGLTRNTTSPDIGANELTLCQADASLVTYVELSQNMDPSGVPLTVRLQNSGTTNLTQTTIHWSINNQEQSPINLSNINLQSQSTFDVFIGIIPSGLTLYEIQAWVEGANNAAQDCNVYNDSLNAIFIYSPLCGNYNLGSIDSDFENFSEASNALHIAGVSCPVTINVLPGEYYEQIDFYEISGASSTNTITFLSQGSSPSAFVNYNNAPNCRNGYILNVDGADYLAFENLGIYGNNMFVTDIMVRSSSDHLSFRNCILGNTVFDQGALIEGAEFLNNSFVFPKLILDLGTGSSEIVLEGNSGLGILVCNNASDVVVGSNHARRINASSFDLGYFDGNILDSLYLYSVDSLKILNNTVSTCAIYGVSHNMSMLGNTLFDFNVSNAQFIDCRYNAHQSTVFNNCQYLEVSENTSSGNATGISFSGCNYLNCYENSLQSKIGLSITNTDNARIHHNTINCQLIEQSFGILTYGASEYLVIDSNTVFQHKSGGIHVNSAASDMARVRYNEVSGSGVQMKLSGIGVIAEANRIVNCTDATGIVIEGSNMVVFNNYIQIAGESVCKGVYVTSTQGVSLFYNSIFLNGSNGGNRALQVDLANGSNAVYNIKNNIFSVSPPPGSVGSFASFELNTPPASNFNCDYNCLYSSNSVVGRISNAPYVSLGAFMSVLLQGSAHHCISVNPNFASNSNLLPYNIIINRQGIGLNGLFDLYPGLNLDIDGEIRDNYQPDIGAQEFRANFAVLELISPTLDCVQSSDEQVIAGIRQYGDIPFFDIQIAYSVNGGEPVYNTIPGAQFNDIDYAFQGALSDLSANGQYEFVVWLVNNFDDVAADDTLSVTRYSLPAPWIQNFSFAQECANVPIEFSASASATGGVITSLEWDFGDGTTGIGSSVYHEFNAAADYEITLFAFRDSACYSDTSGIISLFPTPDISFGVIQLCSGTPLQFFNGTELLNGSGNMSFAWNFGDGSFSTAVNPTNVFDTAGYYNVTLAAAHVVSGHICRDTLSQLLYINAPPLVDFILDDSYPVNTPPLWLTALPEGGIFSGNGVGDGYLNFNSLTVNATSNVSYSFLDTLTGCTTVETETILITPFYDPPVILQQSNDVLACEGSGFYLEVQSGGALPASYQWFFNGVILPGETNAILLINEASAIEHQGEYLVRIINQYDTVFSEEIQVELGNSDFVSIDTILCPQEFLSIGSGIIADTGYYVVVLSNRFGCDSTITLNVVAGYTDSVEVDTTACAPLFYNGYTFFDDGDYIVVITNRVGCDSVITLHYNKVEVGEICSDDDPCTIDDVYNSDCICAGILTLDEDLDGLCDGQDICLNNPEPGQPCDDENPCTYSDIMEEGCVCIGLLVPDTDGDGVCDSAEVFGCGDPLACNYNPLTTDNYATCEYPIIGYDCEGNCVVFINGTCLNLGCTNPAACNYDAAANFDNDSCQFAGCTELSACNYDAEAGCDDGSCVYAGCIDLSACNFDFTAACSDNSCIYPGCMDPLACNFDEYAVCDTGSCVMPGCIDSVACNYDSNALCSGGMCIYPGCMEWTACNYDPFAGCDDGSCLASGCIDSAACNFNFDAFCDDNSCQYSGCLDVMACNYDSLAACEGICNYPPQYYNCDSTCMQDTDADGVCDALEVVGCIDAGACNYDSAATDASTDIDACWYPETGYDCADSCLYDDDQDGVCNPFEVPGCQDESACNYNSLATDSAMCEYVPVYSIAGNLIVYAGDTVEYTYPNTDGSIYIWSVTGGVIVSGDSTNQIEVVFVEPDSQSVSVLEYTAEGCVSPESVSYLAVEVLIGISNLSSFIAAPTVFPNPAEESISIRCLNEWSNGSWRLLNSLSQTIKCGVLNEGVSIVSLIDLATGLYQMEFVSNTGARARVSVIKK